jgi:hypothetical protein
MFYDTGPWTIGFEERSLKTLTPLINDMKLIVFVAKAVR